MCIIDSWEFLFGGDLGIADIWGSATGRVSRPRDIR